MILLDDDEPMKMKTSRIMENVILFALKFMNSVPILKRTIQWVVALFLSFPFLTHLYFLLIHLVGTKDERQ